MTTAAILQPHYLPYSGFFKLIDESDIFVFLDTVQFEKQSWQDRNRIKTPEGKALWLRVPTIKKFGELIKDVKINNSINWQEKQWASIKNTYQKAKFFEYYKKFFEEIYSKEWEYLADLDIEIIKFIAKEFGLTAKFINASDLGKACHRKRISFEEALNEIEQNDLKRKIYQNIAELGIGRSILVFARKKK